MATSITAIVTTISHQAAVPRAIRTSINVGVQKGRYDSTFVQGALGEDAPRKNRRYPKGTSMRGRMVAFCTSSCRLTIALSPPARAAYRKNAKRIKTKKRRKNGMAAPAHYCLKPPP